MSTRSTERALHIAFVAAISVFASIAVQAQIVPKAGSPLYGPRPELGATSSGLPDALKEVGIEQRLNEQVPLDLEFRDETGRAVKLRDYFGKKPVLLALVYYRCPMLCTQILTGVTGALKGISFDAGKEFDVVTVSFDPADTPETAAAKKAEYVPRYGREGSAAGWHFLTGQQKSIQQLTAAVGFKYYYDEQTKQFAHASGIMILTPEGRLARYFYGIEYAPKDVRLGLVEASQNKIGSPVDKLLLYCFHYDPATGKYGLIVMNLVRVGGVVTVLGFVVLLILVRRTAMRRARLSAGGPV